MIKKKLYKKSRIPERCFGTVHHVRFKNISLDVPHISTCHQKNKNRKQNKKWNSLNNKSQNKTKKTFTKKTREKGNGKPSL